MQTPSPPSYHHSFADSELETLSEPPEYTSTSTRGSTVRPPTRARRQGPKEFVYDLKTRKGDSWVILTVLGDPALSKQRPSFVEGKDIVGSVKLSLESADSIRAVTVSVAGQIILSANFREFYTFLNQTWTLWSKSMGDPRSSATVSESDQRKYNGKLQGDYAWPFSLKLPREVSLPVDPKQKILQLQRFHLPQTFTERFARATIEYSLVVDITRNKLRAHSKLEAQFNYMPIIQPQPPSILRQLAYMENSQLLGPDIDPEGWHTLEPVRIRGTIFSQRLVDAKCTFSLAKPLSYTRGSVIPCAMTIESSDLQALDLLSAPSAIVTRLRRCVKSDSRAWLDAFEHSESAAWWPSTEEAANTNPFKRYLHGEIHLKSDLKPSSAIATFRIEYSVVVFPFDAVAFESADTEPLLVGPVEIATTFAAGPRPRTYSPADYQAHVAAPIPGPRYCIAMGE